MSEVWSGLLFALKGARKINFQTQPNGQERSRIFWCSVTPAVPEKSSPSAHQFDGNLLPSLVKKRSCTGLLCAWCQVWEQYDAVRLLDKLKSPQAIFRASASELEGAGMSPAQARNVASGCSFEDAVDQQHKLLNCGAQPHPPCTTSATLGGCGNAIHPSYFSRLATAS